MQACNADLGALRTSLLGYLDNVFKNIVIENAGCQTTAAFQRVPASTLHAHS